MSAINGYRYAATLFDSENRSLGQLPIEVDWTPARERLCLEALRTAPGGCNSLPPTDRVVIRPLWHDTIGEPYVQCVQGRVPTNDGEVVLDFSTEYFRPAAQRVAAQFVQRGALAQGDQFRYVVCAFRSPPDDPSHAPGTDFQVEEIPAVLPLRSTAYSEFEARAVEHGIGRPEDVPAFVPQCVLEEIEDATRRAGAMETGGVLLGDLHRDVNRSDRVFVVIAAQIPASFTQAAATKLTFTAETWSAVESAIRLRNKNEILVGWWHSHPVRYWCRDCPPERRSVCPLQSRESFFSSDDSTVHRTVFSRAYTLALVASHHEEGIEFASFGWRDGAITPRGFHVLDASRPLRALENKSRMEGTPHGTACGK